MSSRPKNSSCARRQRITEAWGGSAKDAFDEVKDPAAKARDAKTLEQVQALGVKLVRVKVPEFSVDVSAYPVESATFFDELIRSGRDKQLTNPSRGNGWRNARLMPAVEYLQSQRARMMMMMKLAEATADVDVYLAPGNNGGGGAPDGAGRGGRGGRGGDGGPGNQQPQTLAQRHSTMANSRSSEWPK